MSGLTRIMRDLERDEAPVERLKAEIEKVRRKKEANVSQAVAVASDLLRELDIAEETSMIS